MNPHFPHLRRLSQLMSPLKAVEKLVALSSPLWLVLLQGKKNKLHLVSKRRAMWGRCREEKIPASVANISSMFHQWLFNVKHKRNVDFA